MGTCSHCGTSSALTRSCNHCGKTVCTEHTLPEAHDCPAVRHFERNTKRLESDLSARRNADATGEDSTDGDAGSGDSSSTDSHTCANCGSEYDYLADARHCCQSTPEPIEGTRTYGGSGRDYENADFPSSPDVNPDGSAGESDVTEPRAEYRTDDRTGRGWVAWFGKWVVPYLVAGAVIAVLQFGVGVDVVGFLAEIVP